MEVNYLMRCCGVKEINCLSSYDNQQQAMIAFCRTIYPSEQLVTTRYNNTLKRAEERKEDPFRPGYIGASTTGAVYDNVGQYSRFRFAIFTEAVTERTMELQKEGYRYQYGHMFADLIRKENLGSLVCTEKHELNPNSGQYVKVWVWGIDHGALKKWHKTNDKELQSWVQKAMSAVIGSAESAEPTYAPPQPDFGIMQGSAGLEQTLNSVSTILGSQPLGRQQTNR